MLYKIALVAASILACSSAKADILFGEDFEDAINSKPKSDINAVWMSNMSADGKPVNHEGSGNLSGRVTEPALRGNYAYRFGLSYFFDYRSFNGGLQKPRTALLWNDARAELVTNREYWVGFAVMFPEEYLFDQEENPDNIFQLVKNDHGTTGELHKNAIAWALYGDRLTMRWQHNKGEDNPAIEAYGFQVERGVWHQIVMHFKLTTLSTPDAGPDGANGFFEIYVDGSKEPVYSVKGANTISENHKIALNFYKYWWHCRADEPSYTGLLKDARGDFEFSMSNPYPTNDDGSVNATRAFYVDDFLVGDENSSIEEVAPSWGKPLKRDLK